MKETVFPKFDYYLDKSDPDILVLCRQDGSFVAHFSAQGATKEGIIQAAQEDYLTVSFRGAGSLERGMAPSKSTKEYLSLDAARLPRTLPLGS